MNLANLKRVAIKRAAKRVWIWVVLLTIIVCAWPVEYQLTRILFAGGVFATWLGVCIRCWHRKNVRVALVVIGLLPVIAICLPGRAVETGPLAEDYCRAMRCFKGVRYVWGGESFLGIDCSGLVRKGLAWGQLYHGLRTLNGRPIRDAILLWWNDCSALALRDGFRGWTVGISRFKSVEGANLSLLKPGDMAVTDDGVHIMAYLGNRTWIEADPEAHQVIETALPTDIHWFKVPVIFLRWKWLAEPESVPPSGLARGNVRAGQ